MELSNNSLNRAFNTFLGMASSLDTDSSLYATPDQINGMFATNRSTSQPVLNGAPILLNTSSDTDYGMEYTYNIETNNVWKTLSGQLSHIINIVSQKKLHEITEEEADDIVSDAERFGYDWIYNHYGKHDIEEDGDLIVTRVVDKIADYLDERLHEDYDFEDWPEMYDALMEILMEKIHLDYVLSVIDEIMQAPVTIEEKLRDIGMSQNDFV